METLEYIFDDTYFEYDVCREIIETRLAHKLAKEWTKEELIEFIINSDGSELELMEDFKEEIRDCFEKEAREFYIECKSSDDGIDQKDLL